MTTIFSIKEIEEYLDDQKAAFNKGSRNIPLLLNTEKYDEKIENADYWRFIQFGDYHYFVSRILFINKVYEYSMFSGYQCIENYLKGYLKYHNINIKRYSHPLDPLLQTCKQIAPPKDKFIKSKRLYTIILKYRPYYELPRYPIPHQNPGNLYAFAYPLDILVLDYFVLMMRKLIPISEKGQDIFDNGLLILSECMKKSPDFYEIFIKGNINFPGQIPEFDSLDTLVKIIIDKNHPLFKRSEENQKEKF